MNETDQIRNDAYLSRFAENDPDLQNDLPLFLKVYRSRKLCENCEGLFECRQSPVGERSCLSEEDGLHEEVEYCPYALKQKRSKSVLDRYMYCDISRNLADIDLSNIEYTPEQKQLYLALAAILYEKSQRGLYICGDLGVGKTYLCTALANSLVKKGKKVAFVKVSNFFNEMKGYFSTAAEMVDRNISILKNAEYLFLDDIGSETVSEFVRDDVLFRILDNRLENSLVTIFTSNLNKEELLKHYQYDRKEKSNLMNARRLLERIDILSDNFVLSGPNMRRGRTC